MEENNHHHHDGLQYNKVGSCNQNGDITIVTHAQTERKITNIPNNPTLVLVYYEFYFDIIFEENTTPHVYYKSHE